MHRSWECAFFALTTLAAGGARAADDGSTVSEVVVTASRVDLTSLAITASEGAITGEALKLRPAYRVGQYLESVPGLVVTVHSGEGKAYQYLVRGFNLDHGTDIANFVDDIPINRPTNAHGQGYSDLNFIIPETLGGLTFTKGAFKPAIGDFGAVASVHLQIADEIPDQISASAGTLGDESIFLGGSRRFAGDNRFMAAAQYSHVDGPFDPGNNFRKYAGVVRFSHGTAADGYDLTAMYYKGDGLFTTDQPLRAVERGLISRFGTLDPTDGNHSERFSLSGHYVTEGDHWSFASSAYYVRSRQTLFNNFTHFLEDPVNGDQEQQDETRDLAGEISPLPTLPNSVRSSRTRPSGFRVATTGSMSIAGTPEREPCSTIARRWRPTGQSRRSRSATPPARPISFGCTMSASTWRTAPASRLGCAPTSAFVRNFTGGPIVR